MRGWHISSESACSRELPAPPTADEIADYEEARNRLDLSGYPGRVYDIVSDINLPAQFSTEFQGASWVDGASGPAQGARFEGRNRHKAIGEWTTTCIVTAADSGREFSYAVTDVDSPSAKWWFLIEQVDGRTKLRHKMQIGPGESGLSPAIKAMPDKEERIIERRLQEHEANMRVTIEGIKALAEQSASEGS